MGANKLLLPSMLKKSLCIGAQATDNQNKVTPPFETDNKKNK